MVVFNDVFEGIKNLEAALWRPACMHPSALTDRECETKLLMSRLCQDLRGGWPLLLLRPSFRTFTIYPLF